MQKQIFITNGMARCGKDTFAQFLMEHVEVAKYSSIDKIKTIANQCGWEGGKTERDRKFLSDLKILTTEYSDLAFREMERVVNFFMSHDYPQVLLIDIREPDEIDRAKHAFNAQTILITNSNVEQISSNPADAGVYDYAYDFLLDNSGTLEDFREEVKWFAENFVLK